MQGPLILVGQSRSGSTLLVRLLNYSGQAFLINDAYFLQAADGLADNGLFDERAAEIFSRQCVATMLDRSVPDAAATIDRSVTIEPATAVALADLAEELAKRERRWSPILQGLLQSGASACNAHIWGWNTPQDYMHIDRLLEIFPEAKFLFLIRNPFAVLASYKNLPRYWGAERNRYHPVLQALVWRKALEQYETAKHRFEDRVFLIRYEDLIEFTPAFRASLSRFTGVTIGNISLASLGNNSSKRGQPAATISWLEAAICRQITGPKLDRYGYDAPPESRGLGLAGLAVVSWRAAWFYAGKMIRSRDFRQRISRMIQLSRPT